MRQVSLCVFLLCSLFLVTAMSGCAQIGSSGKWLKNRGDALLFEKRTILPDHTYYYRGNEVTPESIIAVDNRYTLKTNVWSKVEITQKMLDDWMYWISTHLSLACPYYGGTILTPTGEKAGVWYSKKLTTTVRILEPGVLQIYPPYSLSGSLCARQEHQDDL